MCTAQGDYVWCGCRFCISPCEYTCTFVQLNGSLGCILSPTVAAESAIWTLEDMLGECWLSEYGNGDHIHGQSRQGFSLFKRGRTSRAPASGLFRNVYSELLRLLKNFRPRIEGNQRCQTGHGGFYISNHVTLLNKLLFELFISVSSYLLFISI